MPSECTDWIVVEDSDPTCVGLWTVIPDSDVTCDLWDVDEE